MGKFGKKVDVKEGLNNYMVGIVGPSGFGKTTLMTRVCEKEFGDDGYMIFDMGNENGTCAIQGATAEIMPNWSHVIEVVDDIVKNKADYPNLKVVVFDTLDETFSIAESYAIAKWNRDNMGKEKFVKADSVNSIYGGYGKGLDAVIDTVKKEISKLLNAGIGVWWTAHLKNKDETDPYTGATYTVLTANMSMKYFKSIKDNSHFVGCGYYDRTIITKELGTNDFTKKKKERKEVSDETRKIKFRDTEFIADSKSRFASVADEIDLDADQFIKALKDAISAERARGGAVESVNRVVSNSDTNSVTPVSNNDPAGETGRLGRVVTEKVVEADISIEDEVPFENDGESKDELINYIKGNFKDTTTECKLAIKNIKGTANVADLPVSSLKEIADLIKKDLTIED